MKHIKLSCKNINLKSMKPINSGIIINFSDCVEMYRYRDDLTNNERLKYLYYKSQLFEIFITICPTKIIKISPYQLPWFIKSNTDITNINKGIELITENKDDIYNIFAGALKYQIFPIFTSQYDEYSFVPTDHLDLFISGGNEKIEVIKQHIYALNKSIKIQPWE